MNNDLKREDYLKLIDMDKVWSKIMIMDDLYKLLDGLEKELDNYTYVSDENFIMDGRKAFLKESVEKISSSDNNQYRDFLEGIHYFYEFVCNDYADISLHSQDLLHMNSMEITDKFNKYKETGIICLEEKEQLKKMLSELKKTRIN